MSPLTLTGVFTLAALAAPAAAQAQSGLPDRALLNRVTTGTVVRPSVPWLSAGPVISPAATTGERALLTRTGPGPDTEAAAVEPVSGDRALLGRRRVAID